MKIPVIDIFAGPGGLGEGFSMLPSRNRRKFDIQACLLRNDSICSRNFRIKKFLSQIFSKNSSSRNTITMMMESDLEKRNLRKELFEKYPRKAAAAKKDAWCTTLGETSSETVDDRIQKALKGEKNWVLIGGPPCQAYSLVGRSRRQWKENLDKSDIRVHLYKEYLRNNCST